MQAELNISYVGLMGQGVAHDGEGNIYFVPGAIPGDRVLTEFEPTGKKYRDARLLEVLERSPDRREPACKFFESCGGCDWLHWQYDAQLKAKEVILKHVIERSGWPPEIELPSVAAESSLGYRNRIQIHTAGGKVGFFRKKSHDVVDIDHCVVAHPKLNEALSMIRGEEAGDRGPHKYELMLQPDGSVLREADQPHASAGFAQVHDAQNLLLQQMVHSLIRREGSRRVLELYAGNGNLTFPCLESVEHVFAIDGSPAALSQARSRLKQDDSLKAKASFVEARIDSRLLGRLPSSIRGLYDTLLLDPPRAGAEGVLKPLVHDELKTIIYVSCSPVAFTKDVACLKECFRFVDLQIIDMFPNTRHIEFVASFSRLPS